MRALALLVALPVALAAPDCAASVANGESLYATFCAACHGSPPRGGAEKGANDPAEIRNAVATVSAMSTFRTFPNAPPAGQRGFTDSQVADLAAYIGSLAIPPAGPAVPAFDYSDLWYTPSESGWGFNIVQHASSNIFGVIYAYEAPNRPVWMVMPGGVWTSSTTFTGKIYRVTAAAAGTPFVLGDVTELGDLVLLFADESHASVDYTVNGIHTRKQITRQPF
jgi:cytochrome c553